MAFHTPVQPGTPLFLPQNVLPSHPERMPEGDLRETVTWLAGFCKRAEKTLEDFKKIVDMPASPRTSSSVLVPCPFDRRHTMPARALLQHSLRCPSSPAGVSEEAARLVSSLRYLRKQTGEDQHGFDPTGTCFWYEGAPGPVRAAVFNQERCMAPGLPSCIKAVMEADELGNTRVPELERFLPSQCWYLQEEVRAWTCLPSSYSWNVVVAAVGSGIDEEKTTEWLLVNSVQHGIVLDPVLASHLFVLVKLFLAAVKQEAFAHWTIARNPSSKSKTSHFHCPALLESGNWLMSQLVSLYQASAARIFILNLLQNFLVVAARSSALEEIVLFPEEEDAHASPTRLDSALGALQERIDLERYLRTKSYLSNLTEAGYLEDYNVLVSNASLERQLRPGYRPLLEHDGLVWHRQQTEETSKTKTKGELLAEARDYKRRRQSYKGKKVRRTPSQVLHDIIEGQMEDIVAAGGIGCFNREGPVMREPSRKQSPTTRDRSHAHYENREVDRASQENGYSRSKRRRESPSRRYERYEHHSRHDRRDYSKEHVRSHDDYKSKRRDRRERDADRYDACSSRSGRESHSRR